jgi:ureidoacrylate peracid hydrolase
MEPTPGRTALVVIDMQNAFCRDDGSFARLGFDIAMLKAAIAPCRRLAAAARAAGVPVIFTRLSYAADYHDGGIAIRYMTPEFVAARCLAAGTFDIEVVDELAPAAGDHVIDKNRFSSFYAPAFERVLAALGVDSLVVCGVTTNCCVESTVRDAFQRNFKAFVVRDAVGELDSTRHEVALQTMQLLFADLVAVEDMVALWAGDPSQAAGPPPRPAARR